MSPKDIDHGLSQAELILIKDILSRNTEITSVGIFGSRANGQYKPYSDLDLVLYGDLNEQDINRINTLFDESHIGLRVDVKGYNNIEYQPLKRHIDSSSKRLFDFGGRPENPV